MFAKFSVLALLVVVVATLTPSHARVLPEVNGIPKFNSKNLSYLGSLSSPSTSGAGSSIKSVTSYYFLTQNAAAYTASIADCKASLDESATLLYIETQEELANVTDFFRSSDDTGSTYWIGGKYDAPKATFLWENGAEIGPWAPWDQGHPDTRTPVTRVFLRRVGGAINFRTQFTTVSTRAVCELRIGEEDEEAEPCYDDNDLVIAVDSSGSITAEKYDKALEFASRLAVAWADNPRNRLSVLIYSTDVESLFGLSQNLTVPEIRDLVYNSAYQSGWTNSYLALDRTVQEFQNNPRAVPNNLVFLTDGESNDPTLTLAAAQRVQAAGIRSFSVGVGPKILPDELLAIAGNIQDHVFNTDGFDDLLKLLKPVSRRVCEG